MGRRGYTLVEVVVALMIGMFVVAATFTFATEQVRLVDFTDDRIGLQQEGRAILSLITADLRQAGLGVGYGADGRFGGLRRGTFTVVDGATFQANDRMLNGPAGAVPTDDLGIRLTRGEIRTVSRFTTSEGQVCAGGRFRSGDRVLLLSRDARFATTAELSSVTPDACRGSFCVSGCETFNYTLTDAYRSGADADAADYEGGELFGGFQEVVYFVAMNPELGTPTLRRAEIGTGDPCVAADATCGSAMARGVDSLQVRVWLLNEATGVWDDVTNAISIDEEAPLRVDLELVLRGETDLRAGYHEPAVLRLAADACVPAPCGGGGDEHHREVLRTSVELRNAGRMRIQ
jgi:hypothetical protein